MEGKSTRTTITLPPGLKTRMDAVADQVNWSAVAAAAFERKLVEIAARREPQNMNDIINRLRESNKECEKEVFEEGRRAGKEWASKYASAKELRRLAKWDNEHGQEMEWVSGDNDAYGVAHNILAVIDPDLDGDRSASVEFWTDCFGEGYPEGELLRGFVVGAIELWDEVRSKL
jgi:hypothetical protein